MNAKRLPKFINYFFQFVAIPLFLLFFGGKWPDINAKDALEILDSIMEAHATYKSFNPTLVKRAIVEYIDELDPSKVYFIEEDVAAWLNPDELLIEKIIKQVEKGDFSFFAQVHEKMVKAIERKKKLDEKINALSIDEKVSFKEFEKLVFAKNEEELITRQARINALQKQTIEKLEEKDAQEKAFQRIAKRRNLHEEEIQDKVTQEKYILTNALKAFASSFDNHTAYFTPQEAAQFLIQVQQKLSGIGAQLRDDITGFTIVKIIEEGPAAKSELKENDRIIAINKEPVVGFEITDAVDLIRGEKGTKVALTVIREHPSKEETLEIEISRDEVIIQESRISSKTIPFGDGVIAHISLFAFYQDGESSSASDLYDEIAKLKKSDKLRGIVLDLRHNAGGVLPQAVAVTSLFIMKGIVVSVKDNQNKIESLRNIETKTAWDGPLIVLTSKATASAAEIVAGSLQDFGRALIVGDEHTFGKGTFQTFTLDPEKGKVNPKGETKVTGGVFFTVSGNSPQKSGYKPDIAVPGLFSKAKIGEQYAKYSLENESIAENFEDDLSDVPSPQKEHLSWLYRFNLQPKLTMYSRSLPILKKNSEERIKENSFYTHFLKVIDEEKDEEEGFHLFVEADPQLAETLNIMKDLIVLSE